MKKMIWAVALMTGSLQVGAVDSVKSLDSKEAEVSYSFGSVFGKRMQVDIPDLDIPAFVQGLSDAYNGRPGLLTEEKIQQVLTAYQRDMQTKQMEMMNKVAAENLKAGSDFLASNKNKEGVVTLASGLQYKILKEGQGPQPGQDDTVKVHYTGSLINGEVFDTSEGGEPVEFPVNAVIAGWTEALQRMPEGSKWRLFIPASLAYGSNGNRGIGPNQVLLFDVELLQVTRKAP